MIAESNSEGAWQHYRQAAYFYSNLGNLGNAALNNEKENAEAKAAEALNAAKLKRRADLDTFGRKVEGKSETDWQQAVKVDTTFYGKSGEYFNQINGFKDEGSVYKCFALNGAEDSEVLVHSY